MKAEWSALKEQAPPSPSSSKEALDLSFLNVVRVGTPVCNLMVEGRPLHPSGKQNKKGLVSVTRTFGGSQVDWELVRRMLPYLEKDEVQEALNTSVYTRGTAAGFVKRLQEQTTRKCVPVTKTNGGKNATIKRLKKLLPYRSESLVDWNQDLGDLVGAITTSAAASAGAPYWRPKADVLHEMQNYVVPILHEHLSEGTLASLRAEQPELFLVECKNKMDRYDPSKLEDKTRPYFSYPFHWSALFSVLSQSFSGALNLFYEGEECANAYGFSWAHGGTRKLVEWAKNCGELGKDGGRPRFCVYGDDCDLYYRRNGKLFRLAPDFRQMDGSVDRECVELTVRYVLEAHAHTHGREAYAFWEAVGEEWVRMATDPEFVVDGTETYRKPQVDGLATGVVGTTLFDTVKAALSYDAFVEQLHTYKRYELLEERNAVAFFRDMGLEIKKGTWVPEPVWEGEDADQLFSPHKFLGMQIRWVGHGEEVEPLPYLPEEDWWHLLLVPRELEVGAPKSQTARMRTQFDRLRGLLTTGAITNERAHKVFNALLNAVPGEVVLMSVQAGGGKGEAPEYAMLSPDGSFEYPLSEGVPEEGWFWTLYTDKGEHPFQRVFPGLEEKLSAYRQAWKRPLPTTSAVRRVGQASALLTAPVAEEPPVVPHTLPLSGKKSETYSSTLKKKSPVVDMVLEGGEIKKTKRARAPTLGEALREYMLRPLTEAESSALEFSASAEVARVLLGEVDEEDVCVLREAAHTRVVPVQEIVAALGSNEVSIRKAALEEGFLVVGPWDSKWITPSPLWLPPAQMETQSRQIEGFCEKVSKKGLGATGHELKQKRKLEQEKDSPAYMPGGVLTVGGGPPRHPAILGVQASTPWETVHKAYATVGVQLTYASQNRRTAFGQEVEFAVMWADQATGQTEPWFEVFGPSKVECRQLAAEAIEEVLLSKAEEDLSQPGAWAESLEHEDRLRVLQGKVPLVRLVKNHFVPEPALAETGWRVEGGRLVGAKAQGGEPIVLAMRSEKTVTQMAESLRRAMGPMFVVEEVHAKTTPPKTTQQDKYGEWKTQQKQSEQQSETRPTSAGNGGGGSSEPKRAKKSQKSECSASSQLTRNRSAAQSVSQQQFISRDGAGPNPSQPSKPGRNEASGRGPAVRPVASKEPSPTGRGGRKPHNGRNPGSRVESRPHVEHRRKRASPGLRHERGKDGQAERLDRIEDTLRKLAEMVSGGAQ